MRLKLLLLALSALQELNIQAQNTFVEEVHREYAIIEYWTMSKMSYWWLRPNYYLQKTG